MRLVIDGVIESGQTNRLYNTRMKGVYCSAVQVVQWSMKKYMLCYLDREVDILKYSRPSYRDCVIGSIVVLEENIHLSTYECISN
jgi:hypothetical protein